MIQMGSTEGYNRKTLGEPLSVDCLRVPRHDGGSGQRWRSKGGYREKERKRYRDRKRGRGRRERHSSLCSLNEVFLLFLCVCMVALSVDDSCVCVGCIVCSFGLVCQVCSWGKRKKQTYIRENKYRAALHGVRCLRRKTHQKTTSVMLHNSYTERWE